jgi:Tfp pilus assembly protein PilO
MSTSAPLRYYLRHPGVRVGLWTGAAFAVLAAVLAALWWPGERSRRALEDDIEARRAEIVQMRERDQVARAYEQARGGVESLETKLAYAATQAQQVADLAQLARQHGVSLISQAYEESTRKNEPPRLYTELTVQGSYRALDSFITGLPQLPSWTEAQDIVIERAHDSGVVKGRMRLVTYRGTRGTLEEK